MFNPSKTMIRDCIKRLQAGYRDLYGTLKPAYAELIGQVATVALHTIARSDALYHNVEHTILVTLVGQEILRGKQIREDSVSCQEWTELIIALLCHDIGYVKGSCRHDNAADCTYATGVGHGKVVLPASATDASLTPHHVDRSKLVVEELLGNQPLLNLSAIQHNIELTRFPIPQDAVYQETASYAGLARAADLIGQLSDPRYLEKIPALFYEFQEVGTHRSLGYQHPRDLRAGYPDFFHHGVCPYIQPALHYLQATAGGREILSSLYANLSAVEQELNPTHPTAPASSGSPLFQAQQLHLHPAHSLAPLHQELCLGCVHE